MNFDDARDNLVYRRDLMSRLAALRVLVFGVLVACSGGGDGSDAGPDVVTVTDAGKDVTVDGAIDATIDATTDAADAPLDTASDASTNPTSIQIQAVRTAAGTTPDGGTLSLPIDDAIVTYTKALVGAEPAGFFVQAEQTGPAIFVAVDPQTLTPVPAPGDQVSFTVTGATVTSGVHMVTALTGFTRTAQNVSLATMLRDVSSATDLVSNLNAYESEYVTLVANVKTSFSTSSSGFVQAQIETTALTGTAALNLRLRTPTTVKTSVGVDVSCSVTLTGIVWRFGGVAQPSGWISADFSSLTCSPPKVKTAVATANTSVLVTFDRDISRPRRSRATARSSRSTTASPRPRPRSRRRTR